MIFKTVPSINHIDLLDTLVFKMSWMSSGLSIPGHSYLENKCIMYIKFLHYANETCWCSKCLGWPLGSSIPGHSYLEKKCIMYIKFLHYANKTWHSHCSCSTCFVHQWVSAMENSVNLWQVYRRIIIANEKYTLRVQGFNKALSNNTNNKQSNTSVNQ